MAIHIFFLQLFKYSKLNYLWFRGMTNGLSGTFTAWNQTPEITRKFQRNQFF